MREHANAQRPGAGRMCIDICRYGHVEVLLPAVMKCCEEGDGGRDSCHRKSPHALQISCEKEDMIPFSTMTPTSL